LPNGKKIDATNPEEWVFPIGTKFFKEFRANGRRVETRLYQKVRDDRWVRATFEWNNGETAATRSQGGDREDITLYGANYHVPSGRECDQCHQGRKDRILGFSEVSLGLAGAQGLTLQVLADEKLLSPPPVRTKLSIGDDGTGMASQVLGWLDINCGVSCHNDNQNAKAYSTGLRMKLHRGHQDQALHRASSSRSGLTRVEPALSPGIDARGERQRADAANRDPGCGPRADPADRGLDPRHVACVLARHSAGAGAGENTKFEIARKPWSLTVR
jgi:hypothetical protein